MPGLVWWVLCVGRPPRDHVVFVWNTTELAVAAGHSIDTGRWVAGLGELMQAIAGRFGRVETRRTAGRMLTGLLSELPVKNCWTLAEYAGDPSPDAMQHLLSRAVWDEDGIRDDLRDYVYTGLGVGGVLVVDETGDLKKGEQTVGVQRQYTGTAGRIENAQVAVYLAYTTPIGHAFIDRELYLPKSWTTDPDRCASAGIPAGIGFATKPVLAKEMIIRALDAGLVAPWVTGDEVYGGDSLLRGELETRGIGYVLAVGCDHRVDTGLGRMRADAAAATVHHREWRALSPGDGVKGPRLFDWARITLDDEQTGEYRWLLIRRNRRTRELAFYRCYAPDPTPFKTLVEVAGSRWSIEENFQTGKNLTGLDQHQVRRWTSWRRWTILVMLAHAFLTIHAAEHTRTPEETTKVIALTRNEIRHLIATTIGQRCHDLAHRLHWSNWRRQHQHRARTSHYQRRTDPEP